MVTALSSSSRLKSGWLSPRKFEKRIPAFGGSRQRRNPQRLQFRKALRLNQDEALDCISCSLDSI
jgi:hypothetical protein